MKTIKYSTVLLAVLFVSTCFFARDRQPAFAHMEGVEGGHTEGSKPAEESDVIAALKTTPEKLTAGEPVNLLFSITGPKGEPVQGLSIMHDRFLHIVIASQDFTVFAHIHPDDFEPVTPELLKTARFPLRFIFPKAGRYLVAADFAVEDRPFSRHFILDVGGSPKMGAPKKDLSREKKFEGYDVRLNVESSPVVSGKEVKFRYIITRDGKPVTDLEPYLSAPMHLAIISADLKNHFIHTHGEVPGMEHHAGHMHMKPPASFGPEIDVHTTFPAKGLYQIFGEFRHHDKVVATSFMVEVE